MLLSPTARASFINDILSSNAESSATPLIDQLPPTRPSTIVAIASTVLSIGARALRRRTENGAGEA